MKPSGAIRAASLHFFFRNSPMAKQDKTSASAGAAAPAEAPAAFRFEVGARPNLRPTIYGRDAEPPTGTPSSAGWGRSEEARSEVPSSEWTWFEVVAPFPEARPPSTPSSP